MIKKHRCTWAASNQLFYKYHDTEWGVPVHKDNIHFEFLILEGAQAGLSWSTILKKHKGYKKAYANFDPKKVSRFTETNIELLLQNPNIVRNKLKVRSAVNNAVKFLEIQKEFCSFDNYVWSFVGNKIIVNKWTSIDQIPTKSRESDTLSKDLRKRGFKFVGPTIIYAYMQAVGLVNDHEVSCFRYKNLIEK